LSLPHPHKPPSWDGFVLAGGRSTRMGQDKALLHLARRPLIQHALDILSGTGLEPKIAGARAHLSSFAPTLPDDPSQSGLGPLSGISTAIASSSAQYAVFLPVDLPLIPSYLIAYLIHYAAITQSAVTLVSVAAFVQTFPVVIDRSALPQLQASLLSKDRNCLRAFRQASHVLSKPLSILPVELLLQSGQVSHPKGFPAALWFLNVNSPQDLARVEALISSQVQVS